MYYRLKEPYTFRGWKKNLIPDQRNCYIHKHIGVENVKKAIDDAIKNAGLEPDIEIENTKRKE